MKKLMATLGRLVGDQRRALGWTQQALSEKSGVKLTTVTKIEQGDIRDPRCSTLFALARALGCSLDAFAGAEMPSRKKS